MTDRIPPHDLEAEIAVLGAMLLVSSALEAKQIGDIVTRGDFYRQVHGDVFAAAIDLWEIDGACDAILLRNGLQESGVLAACGGTSFISRLVASVPSAANATHYARIVRKRRLERDVLAASQLHDAAMAEGGNGTATSAFEQLTKARLELEAFEHPAAKDPMLGVRDLASIATSFDATPVDQFVHRVFARPSFNVVFGPPSAGKSWAIMALLLDASTRAGGNGFLGYENLSVNGRGDDVALWVYGAEDTDDRVDRRLRQLCGDSPDPPGPNRFYAVPIPSGLMLHTTAGMRWLESVIVATKATLVALDTVASLTCGALDVNKAEHVAPFMGALLNLRAKHNLCIFALTHTRKLSGDGNKGLVSHADSMLGSQTWRSLADACLMLDAQDGDTSDVKARLVKSKDIDSPIPTVRCSLVKGTGRFRELEEDEEAPKSEAVGKGQGGRPSAFTVDAVLGLRERYQDGVPWSDLPGLLRGSDRTFRNHSQRLQGELLSLGHVVIEGVLRWAS